MALFEREHTEFSSDAGTRALSAIAVETAFVARVYEKLANTYDFTFGPTLHLGRLATLPRLGIQPGDHILEVGVGTGINVTRYPRHCRITGVDLSASMLERARGRVAKEQMTNVRLLEMDAAALSFPDDTFDIVYAPYLISVVPDPVKVVNEMRRVCRPGGKIVILNHFKSENPILSRLDTLVSPLTVHIGFKTDLDLKGLLAQTNLKPISIEKVSFPRIWSLVICHK